jgi:transposase-like protein
MADMIVEQLNKQGEVTKTYDLRGVFPTNLSTIELSYDNENQIEEFTVEMQVQYWESNTTS